MLKSSRTNPSLNEARLQTSDALAFLAKESLPRPRRIQFALRCIAGWDISTLKPADKRFLERQMVAVNVVLRRNSIQTAADYERIPGHDLDEIEGAIRALAKRFCAV